MTPCGAVRQFEDRDAVETTIMKELALRYEMDE